MQISLLTYNLFYSKALGNLDKVILEAKPDIIMLQEIETTDDNLKKVEKLGYSLSDYSNSFLKHQKIYGIATFYKAQKLSLKNSSSINLPRSVYEMLLFVLRGGNNPRTFLSTEFTPIKDLPAGRQEKKSFTTYNVHLTSWGTNGVRVKQIKETLQTLETDKSPCIVAGDFNFPYGRKQFEMLIKKYNLKEATDNILYTFEKKLLRLFPIYLKLDYVLYQNLQLIETRRIETKFSDHYPIISTFEI